MNSLDLRAIILRANEIIRAHSNSENTKSPQTVAGYRKEWQRLLDRSNVPSDITITSEAASAIIKTAGDTKCLNTWYRRKAAVIFSISELIYRAHSEFIEFSEGTSDHLSSLESKVGELDNYLQCYRLVESATPPVDRKKKGSKKSSITGLSQDWMKKVVEKIHPKYQIPALFLTITGCRPGELTKPLALEIFDDGKGEELIVEIQGIKVTRYSGLPYRRLHFPLPSSDPLVNLLAKVVKHKGGKTSIVPCSNIKTNTLTRTISRIAVKIFGKRKNGISGYSFRHQFASNLKASRFDTQEISAALGHSVTRTQSRYGSHAQGSHGSLGIGKVVGAAAVRVNHKDPAQGIGGRKKRKSKP